VEPRLAFGCIPHVRVPPKSRSLRRASSLLANMTAKVLPQLYPMTLALLLRHVIASTQTR
jgi:hypothetical protein